MPKPTTAAIEIERKFVIQARPSGTPVKTQIIRQAYIAREGGNNIRIRDKDGIYILSIKGQTGQAISRHEIEYEISKKDADVLFSIAQGALIEKVREVYDYEGHLWEVDIFKGDNEGLIIAEVELKSEDEEISPPNWIGAEVTHLRKFYNGSLASRPFKSWGTTYEALVDRLTS